MIAGFTVDSSGVQHGFIERGGRFTAVNDPHAGTASGQGTSVGSINDAGVVVGNYFDASGVVHGFTERRGVFTPVEDPAGPGGTNAGGISNRGVIVGFYFDSSGSIHGFELSPAR